MSTHRIEILVGDEACASVCQSVTGPTGAVGPAGADGTDGIDGAVGPEGPQGDPGADGADGADGAQGPQGDPGADGADGAPGADGTDGIDGADGVDTTPPPMKVGAAAAADAFVLSETTGTTAYNTRVLNKLHYIPIWLPTGTVVRLAQDVGTGEATAVQRLGLYGISNGKPGALLVDGGTIDASSPGRKTVTVSVAVTAGWYYGAVVHQVAATSQTSLGQAGNAVTNPNSVSPTAATRLWESSHAFFELSVSGALPGTATPLYEYSYSASVPLFAVRY